MEHYTILDPLSHTIDRVIAGIPGFTDTEELQALFNIAYSLGGDIVEIGSWLGRSSVILGLAARYFDRKVYCVDLFPSRGDWKQNDDKSWSIVTKDEKSAYKNEHRIYNDTFASRFLPAYSKNESTLVQFIDNINSYELDGVVIPVRGDISSFVKSHSGIKPKLIFIDGDHDYPSVRRDIEVSASILDRYGVMCIDDVGGAFTSVTRAVRDSKLSNIILVTRKLAIATVN